LTLSIKKCTVKVVNSSDCTLLRKAFDNVGLHLVAFHLLL